MPEFNEFDISAFLSVLRDALRFRRVDTVTTFELIPALHALLLLLGSTNLLGLPLYNLIISD